MDVKLSDYVAGGYFVVKPSDHGFWKSELTPERVISLSPCIAEKLDIVWSWNIEKHRETALNFGLLEDQLEAFRQWGSKIDGDFYAINSLNEARHALQNFFLRSAEVLLIGAGLHRELIDEFLTYKPYPDEHPNYVLYEQPEADQHRSNLLKEHFVNQRIPLPEDGQPLGFEVISYFYGWGHSWLCSGLEKDMHELFSIRPNQYGLIDSYDEAKKVYDWIAEDERQGTRGEPEPYYPWLLVQYPV
jgi:hypothetical protein